MKYAITNGQREEAQPDRLGECPSCGSPMVAKCGEIRVWHWAHLRKRICDPWWENETEWHRTWKDYFPAEWQERVHFANNGEKHIADVKTIKNWVIEFQHSPLKSDERQARNDFYEKLVWVVDGTNRKRDKAKFYDTLREVNGVTIANAQSPVRRIFKILFPDECALLRDWVTSPTAVFFDFGKDDPVLWCLLPKKSDGDLYVLEFLRGGFITFHRNELVEKDFFADLMNNFGNLVLELSSHLRVQRQNQSVLQSRRFPQYSNHQLRELSRRRL